MFHIIYKITNLINNKIYIGAHSTININDDYMGSGHTLKRSQKKYGIENFTKDVLFIFNTSDEMYKKEAEIVTKSFCMEQTNYNVRVGGIGGFNHYNGTDQHKESAKKGGRIAAQKTNAFVKEQKANNTIWWQNRLKSMTDANRKKAGTGLCNGWRNYTEEEKVARRSQLSQMQKGTGNSQYGKYWISHPETKEILRINKDDTIPEGWVRGKKGHVPTRIWVHNGMTEHYIFIQKLDQHIKSGYSIGRLVKPKRKVDNI